MYGFYTVIIILEAVCIYHAYRNNAEQRWYWFIFLFPVIGCLIYLYHHFFNRNTIANIAEGVKVVVNSNHRIDELEKAVKVTENVTNRLNLADAYVENNRFDEAIDLYLQTLNGFMEDDPLIRMKLLNAFYLKKDYSSAIDLGLKLEKEKSFLDSEQRISFAWALHYSGQTEAAAKLFELMDKSFTNYLQRVEYCKFLKETNQQDKLKDKMSELTEEFELMKSRERKMYRNEWRILENLYLAKV
jgi:hypothetical protein